jgi:predicted enzyme related to lactoylglutathione lyase
LPVTDLVLSIKWFERIFGSQLEWQQEEKAKISFANKSGIVLVRTSQLNSYSHIPFNLESRNMIKSLAMLNEKGVTVSRSSISDGFHCFDFFDPDGNRVGMVGGEVPSSSDEDENIEIRSTFLAVKNIDKVIEWYSDIFSLSFIHSNMKTEQNLLKH